VTRISSTCSCLFVWDSGGPSYHQARSGLSEFRALRSRAGPRLTLLVGPNAVGKTNLVEAMQLLTTTESFRRPQWHELIKWDEKSAVEARCRGRRAHARVEHVVTAEGKRQYRVNGKAKRRLDGRSRHPAMCRVHSRRPAPGERLCREKKSGAGLARDTAIALVRAVESGIRHGF
jgi:energy-coupling factor transporter ATP-binding protein EcfA2